MRLHLEFNVDNAAYRDDTNAVLCGDVADTLRGAADIIEMHGEGRAEEGIRNASWLIVDPNGNTVGRWTFVDDSSEAKAKAMVDTIDDKYKLKETETND